MTMKRRFAANCWTMFSEVPMWDRAQAARASGFEAVEYPWPFGDSSPSPGEVDAFIRAVSSAGIELACLNFYGGNLEAGDRGVISDPARVEGFAPTVEVTRRIGEELGCSRFNLHHGLRLPGVDPEHQAALARQAISAAADAVRPFGGVVLVEPLAGMEAYPVRTPSDAVEVISRVGLDNLGLLADLYHWAAQGLDVDAELVEFSALVRHVQLADYPGRHEPGTGVMDIAGHLRTLEAIGYQGWIGLEYIPSVATVDCLGWIAGL